MVRERGGCGGERIAMGGGVGQCEIVSSLYFLEWP